MFNKKCPRCKEKLKNSYEFCPSCGLALSKKSGEKHGILGKKDYVPENQNSFGNLRGFSGGIFDKMVGSAMKMLEKEMNKEFNRRENPQNHPQNMPFSNTKIKLMINGKEVTPKISGMAEKNGEKDHIKKLPVEFSKNNLNKFKKLKKIEPKTHVRRIGDKLRYELEIPGVKSINDISISKMEEGLEVKAVSDKKAYSKNISINLPLIKYILSKGVLSLEMDTKE